MTDIRVKMEVVVNTCYGGYGLSREAQTLLAERKGLTLVEHDGYLYVDLDTYNQSHHVVGRNDPDLVQVVRELGDRANTDCSKLKIVEVEIGVDFESRDGIETVNVWGSASR